MNIFEKLKNGEPVDMMSEEYGRGRQSCKDHPEAG